MFTVLFRMQPETLNTLRKNAQGRRLGNYCLGLISSALARSAYVPCFSAGLVGGPELLPYDPLWVQGTAVRGLWDFSLKTP